DHLPTLDVERGFVQGHHRAVVHTEVRDGNHAWRLLLRGPYSRLINIAEDCTRCQSFAGGNCSRHAADSGGQGYGMLGHIGGNIHDLTRAKTYDEVTIATVTPALEEGSSTSMSAVSIRDCVRKTSERVADSRVVAYWEKARSSFLALDMSRI